MKIKIYIFLIFLLGVNPALLRAEFIRDEDANRRDQARIVTYFPSPDAVYTELHVNGSATLAKDADAHVGMRTNEPLSKFEVNGDAVLAGGVVTAQGLRLPTISGTPAGINEDGWLWIDET